MMGAATTTGPGPVGAALRYLVAAATLCGAASDDEALGLLSRIRGFRDQSEGMRLRAARWLRDLYPPPTDLATHTKRRGGRLPYWGPLQPDLLAEHLVATTVDPLPGFLTELLEYASGECYPGLPSHARHWPTCSHSSSAASRSRAGRRERGHPKRGSRPDPRRTDNAGGTR